MKNDLQKLRALIDAVDKAPILTKAEAGRLALAQAVYVMDAMAHRIDNHTDRLALLERGLDELETTVLRAKQ